MLDVAIVGAGPYGLSVAAHLKHIGLTFRIFGRTMDSWLAHMPKGMLLKSDGFASNLYDPEAKLTMEKYCAERGIPYSHTKVPVSLDTFSSYGVAFRTRIVPEVEEKMVIGLDQISGGFSLRLEDGQKVTARRVILAVGITHFQFVPPELRHLPADLLSHSYCHYDLEKFRGRDVVVRGGGSSAIDLAVLLHEIGARVQLVARRKALKFHGAPSTKKPSWWDKIRRPQSGIGPGLKTKLFADAPNLFRLVPAKKRLEIVKKTLGPAGGWFTKDKLLGHVPIVLGSTIEKAEAENGKVRLQVALQDGSRREIVADHVIAATGYKVDMERLKFLSAEIRSKIKTLEGSPILSSSFESSVPHLYFVGVAAASSFGPVMRFAFGAGFTARKIAQTMKKAVAKSPRTALQPSQIAASAGK